MTVNTWWVLTYIVSQRVLDFAATLLACVPVLNWVCCLFSHFIMFSFPCCFMCFGLRRVVIFIFKKCVPFLHLLIKPRFCVTNVWSHFCFSVWKLVIYVSCVGLLLPDLTWLFPYLTASYLLYFLFSLLYFSVCNSLRRGSTFGGACTSNLMCWEYLQTRVRCSLHSCSFCVIAIQ